MEGFGDKSCENLLNAVEKSREVKAVNFIYALCIPMIGVDAARKIVGSVSFNGFLERMKNGQGFEDVDGIGPEKSADSVFFNVSHAGDYVVGVVSDCEE